MTFGQRLKALRVGHGWTLEEVHQRSGVTRSYIWSLEHDRSQPTLHILKQLSDALGVSLLVLIGEESIESPVVDQAMALRELTEAMEQVQRAWTYYWLTVRR
jgi:transcriptional regulator with XRE-family HTH domain